MSKRNNYTNYRNMTKPVDEAVPADVKEDISEAIEEVAADEPTPVEEALPETLIGKVSGCKQLNIRREANIDSDKVTVVPDGAVLVIEPDESTDEWFKVYTEAGVEGFCMKKFVTVVK